MYRARRLFRALILILFVVLLVSFCSTENEATYMVFFGRDISAPAGETGYVSDEDWADFEQSVVAPTLSNYTVMNGRGGYLPDGSETVVHEETIILMYVAADSDAAREKIEDVADAYKERFSQESVFIIKNRTEVLRGGVEDENGFGLFLIIAVIFGAGVVIFMLKRRGGRRSWH